MKMYATILLLAVLPTLANAESYLCVAEYVTGFQFITAEKEWQQRNFRATDKYLVKPNKDESVKGKWIVSRIGEQGPFAFCEYGFTSSGALRCDGNFGEFKMNKKSLRFLRPYIVGYWTDAIPGEQDGTFVEGENTPTIGIGKCSVLEP